MRITIYGLSILGLLGLGFLPLETSGKRSILFKFKGNFPGQGNWTAVRLPARDRGIGCPG